MKNECLFIVPYDVGMNEFVIYRGRTAMVMLVMAWTVAGPMNNANYNMKMVAQTVSCIQVRQ